MKHSLPILTRWLPWGAGLLAAVVVGLLLEALTWMEADRREQAERAAVQAEVATARSRLESEMNATLSLSLGLSSFVLAKPDFTETDLIQVAGALVRMQPSIRSVAIAPDNQIRYIYPRAGNEKALGLRYLETPSQRDAVLRLMREQRPPARSNWRRAASALSTASPSCSPAPTAACITGAWRQWSSTPIRYSGSPAYARTRPAPHATPCAGVTAKVPRARFFLASRPCSRTRTRC
ncbi:MAG: hypothetical protein AB1720_08175 [Pseudomonadota bacterium]